MIIRYFNISNVQFFTDRTAQCIIGLMMGRRIFTFRWWLCQSLGLDCNNTILVFHYSDTILLHFCVDPPDLTHCVRNKTNTFLVSISLSNLLVPHRQQTITGPNVGLDLWRKIAPVGYSVLMAPICIEGIVYPLSSIDPLDLNHIIHQWIYFSPLPGLNLIDLNHAVHW